MYNAHQFFVLGESWKAENKWQFACISFEINGGPKKDLGLSMFWSWPNCAAIDLACRAISMVETPHPCLRRSSTQVYVAFLLHRMTDAVFPFSQWQFEMTIWADDNLSFEKVCMSNECQSPAFTFIEKILAFTTYHLLKHLIACSIYLSRSQTCLLTCFNWMTMPNLVVANKSQFVTNISHILIGKQHLLQTRVENC